MCLRFMFLLIMRLAAALRLSGREEAWKTAEILILRHQVAVLQRRQPHRPKLSWADRALLAALVGVIPKARRHRLRLLVTPETILRWHRDIVRRRWAARSKRGRTGRPATRRNIKALVLRLARENPPAGATVWEILNKAEMDPAPRRTAPTWPQFLRSQAEAILACDFFTCGTARRHPGLCPGRDRARHQARPHPRSHFASNRRVDHPAGPEPDHGPGRAGAPGQVHDPRPRLKLHGCVRRGPRRCRDPDRAQQRADAPDERDSRTLDRRMPARAPGPNPHLEPEPSAAD